MVRRLTFVVLFLGALALVAASAASADAHGRFGRRCYYGPVIVGPPVVYRSYYPARYYYGHPYWGPRYYRSGIYIGW